MKSIIIFTVAFFSINSLAEDYMARGKTLDFDNAINAGSVSRDVGEHKPFIILSSEHSIVGEVTCKNSVLFGNNWVNINIRDKRDASVSELFTKEMEESDCRNMIESLMSGEKTVQITFDANIYNYNPSPYLTFKVD